ncbi:MAG: 30S ribosomal protein S7 [Candidatus Aenigmarchaeota archaeon]|nr:30S ribosomal protein S7 [Candidatus Aenigmarchaeota archaeon]
MVVGKKQDIRKSRVPRKQKKIEKKEKREKKMFPLKLFGRWSSEVEVHDIGIKPYINLDPYFVPRSTGKYRNTFHKSKSHIVERLAQHMLVAGHQGKRHKLTSGVLGGKMYNAVKNIEKALEMIENKEKKNPLEVVVKAIETAALREEIISFQVGSVMAREAVVTAPQRRVDKTLRFLAQGAYRKSFNKKTTIAQALADEITASAAGKESFAVREKERIEREAAGSR